MEIKGYKAELREEYKSLITRLEKLQQVLEDKNNGIVTITKEQAELLEVQGLYMEAYAGVLRDRAKLEGIKLI